MKFLLVLLFFCVNAVFTEALVLRGNEAFIRANETVQHRQANIFGNTNVVSKTLKHIHNLNLDLRVKQISCASDGVFLSMTSAHEKQSFMDDFAHDAMVTFESNSQSCSHLSSEQRDSKTFVVHSVVNGDVLDLSSETNNLWIPLETFHFLHAFESLHVQMERFPGSVRSPHEYSYEANLMNYNYDPSTKHAAETKNYQDGPWSVTCEDCYAFFNLGVKFDLDWSWADGLKNIKLEFYGVAEAKAVIRSSFDYAGETSWELGSFTFASLPVYVTIIPAYISLLGSLTVKLNAEVHGSMLTKVGYTASCTLGTKYSLEDSNFHSLNNYTLSSIYNEAPEIDVSGNAKVSLLPELTASFFGISDISIGPELYLEANAFQSQKSTELCGDPDAIYYKLEWGINGAFTVSPFHFIFSTFDLWGTLPSTWEFELRPKTELPCSACSGCTNSVKQNDIIRHSKAKQNPRPKTAVVKIETLEASNACRYGCDVGLRLCIDVYDDSTCSAYTYSSTQYGENPEWNEIFTIGDYENSEIDLEVVLKDNGAVIIDTYLTLADCNPTCNLYVLSDDESYRLNFFVYHLPQLRTMAPFHHEITDSNYYNAEIFWDWKKHEHSHRLLLICIPEDHPDAYCQISLSETDSLPEVYDDSPTNEVQYIFDPEKQRDSELSNLYSTFFFSGPPSNFTLYATEIISKRSFSYQREFEAPGFLVVELYDLDVLMGNSEEVMLIMETQRGELSAVVSVDEYDPIIDSNLKSKKQISVPKNSYSSIILMYNSGDDGDGFTHGISFDTSAYYEIEAFGNPLEINNYLNSSYIYINNLDNIETLEIQVECDGANQTMDIKPGLSGKATAIFSNDLNVNVHRLKQGVNTIVKDMSNSYYSSLNLRVSSGVKRITARTHTTIKEGASLRGNIRPGSIMYFDLPLTSVPTEKWSNILLRSDMLPEMRLFASKTDSAPKYPTSEFHGVLSHEIVNKTEVYSLVIDDYQQQTSNSEQNDVSTSMTIGIENTGTESLHYSLQIRSLITLDTHSTIQNSLIPDSGHGFVFTVPQDWELGAHFTSEAIKGDPDLFAVVSNAEVDPKKIPDILTSATTFSSNFGSDTLGVIAKPNEKILFKVNSYMSSIYALNVSKLNHPSVTLKVSDNIQNVTWHQISDFGLNVSLEMENTQFRFQGILGHDDGARSEILQHFTSTHMGWDRIITPKLISLNDTREIVRFSDKSTRHEILVSIPPMQLTTREIRELESNDESIQMIIPSSLMEPNIVVNVDGFIHISSHHHSDDSSSSPLSSSSSSSLPSSSASSLSQSSSTASSGSGKDALESDDSRNDNEGWYEKNGKKRSLFISLTIAIVGLAIVVFVLASFVKHRFTEGNLE